MVIIPRSWLQIPLLTGGWGLPSNIYFITVIFLIIYDDLGLRTQFTAFKLYEKTKTMKIIHNYTSNWILKVYKLMLTEYKVVGIHHASTSDIPWDKACFSSTMIINFFYLDNSISVTEGLRLLRKKDQIKPREKEKEIYIFCCSGVKVAMISAVLSNLALCM